MIAKYDKNKIAVVICYCSNDYRFIERCLEQASLISNNIVVPISDHLYGGDLEDIRSIENLAAKYPLINFSIFEWHSGKHPRYWHNISRLLGNQMISDEYKWVLFLDADEILDADAFKKFVINDNFESYDTYKLGCYWYFRDPIYQSKSYEASPVLIRKHLININPEDMHCEREQMFEYLNVRKQFLVLQDNKPLVHHFSWVRTKEEMLRKVHNWGHKNDTNWIDLVEEEFSRPFNGTDFIHGYEYNIVENKFNL
jgi:hypothetical protein